MRAYRTKEGIKKDLIVNSLSLLKNFMTEVSNLCSLIDSSLMTEPERLLQREQMAISYSLESLPQRLLKEQQTKIPQYLAILAATGPVNNIIVPHVRSYYTPERFVIFQLIQTYYKNEIHGK